MQKESKFRRFPNRPYEVPSRNSNDLSIRSAIRPTRPINNSKFDPAFLGTTRSGTNKDTNSLCQQPCIRERYDLTFPIPMYEECSREIKNSGITVNQKPHISDEKNCVMPQLDREHLKLFQQHLVDVMYRGKQCSNCGSRFKSGDIDGHLDMHFQINSVRRRTYKPCRLYYGTIEEFLGETSTVELASVSFGREKDMKTAPRSATNKSGLLTTDIVDICDGCHEEIAQFFNDEDEEWQLDDAIKIDGNIYHRICAHSVDS